MIIYLLGLTKEGFHIFNIGTGKGCSVLELIRTFEEVNNVKIPYKFVSRRPGDVASCYADVHRSAQAFKWIATKGVEEMCSSAWNFKIRS